MSGNVGQPTDVAEQVGLRTLPNGWCWANLRQLGDVVTGSTPSKQNLNNFGGTIPFFKPTDLNAGYHVRDYSDSLTELGTRQARLLPARAVLVTCIGATLGKTGLSRVPCATNQQINALITPADTSLPEWCFWAFVSSIGQGQIKFNSSATTLPILNKSRFERIWLPIAPSNEQRRIVAKIEELFSDLDAGVAALERAKANLKRYRASVLKAAVDGSLTAEWRAKHPNVEPASKLLERILVERRRKWEADQLAKFKAAGNEPPKNWRDKYVEPSSPDAANLPELPVGWCWATIRQLGFVDVGFAFKSAEYTKEGVRLLRGENIEPGSLRWQDVRYWPKDKLTGFEHLLIEEGDIVLAMDRPLISTGLKLARAKASDLPCLLVQRMARFRMIDPSVTEFLHASMQTQSFISHLLGDQTGTQLPHISGSGIEEFVSPLPPMAEQPQLASELARQMSVIVECSRELFADLHRAARLRQSILKQAFEGKLVPQNFDDEPASVLLERIRVQSVLPSMTHNGDNSDCETKRPQSSRRRIASK